MHAFPRFILAVPLGCKSSFFAPSLAGRYNLAGCKMKSCVLSGTLFGMSNLYLRYFQGRGFMFSFGRFGHVFPQVMLRS